MTNFSQEEYIAYRIKRARESIEEVETHLNNGYWNTAVNRMYYACFYAVTPLLAQNNIVTGSHSGVRQKFGELYVKTSVIDRETAKLFTELFEKRQKGDYNDFFDFDENTARILYPGAKSFIEKIELLVNIQKG